VQSAGLALLLFAAPVCGEGVGWRGDGSGCYPQANPPTQWDIDQGTNILWQTDVGPGQSSPIITGKRIFITAARDMLLCVDLLSGKVLWKRDNGYEALPAAVEAPKRRPPAFPSCGYCTPTPVTDGKYAYASYGTGIVVCHDLDGQRCWIRYFNRKQVNGYGRTASPLLVGGKLLISIGGLLALDPHTGKIEYRQQLEIPSAGGMPGMEAANIYGSLTMVGEHLLLTNDIGDTLVLAPGRAFREEFHNYLDEGSGATAVADGGLLLLRGTKKLYCIGSK
jgi:outer membrane protein assembly factor BamB